MSLPHENKIVAGLTEIIALERGYSPAKARLIRNAAALHDVGKIKIPNSILTKPGSLTAREFEIIKTHTTKGVELLSSVKGELGEAAKLISLFHHEWHDPSAGGYWGVSLSLLPDYISFAAIADVFVACCSERVYKAEWPTETVLEYLESQADTQFCPKLVKEFISLIRNDSRVSAICSPILRKS